MLFQWKYKIKGTKQIIKYSGKNEKLNKSDLKGLVQLLL